MADNRISLTIADTNIYVSTSEDESYVKALAEDIDRDIRDILEHSSSASVTSAALLCGIDYLDSYRKANRSAGNLRNQIKEYLSDAANAKLQFDEERRRSGELELELQAFRSHLSRLASEGDSSGAVEQMKADLARANNERMLLQKQISDLTAQNAALSEKAGAMNDYISGQDAEIDRLNSIISTHLGTIKSLDIELHSLNGELDAVRREKEDMQKEIDRLSGKREKLTLPEVGGTYANEERYDFSDALYSKVSLEDSEPAEEDKSATSPEDAAETSERTDDKTEKPLPKVVVMPSPERTSSNSVPFAFDIDIDDKPDEFWKNGRNTDTGELPDLGWTKNI